MLGVRMTAASILAFMLTGCVTDVSKHADTITLSEADRDAAGQILRLNDDFSASLVGAFRMNRLESNTEWECVGSIPAGDVFEPQDSVLMVRTWHAHEAYIVIDEGLFVGAFLPVEKAFIRAREVHPLPVVLEVDLKESDK